VETKLFCSRFVGRAEQAFVLIAKAKKWSIEYSIIGKDLDRETLLWNDFARRLYSYEPAEVLHKATASIPNSAGDVAQNPHEARSVEHKNPRLQRRGKNEPKQIF